MAPRRTDLAYAALGALALAGMWASLGAQHAGTFRGSLDDPSINYSNASLNNVVSDVNSRLLDGSLRFTFDGRSGFLQSALDALQLPVDSQLLVFSRTSLQGRRISEQNPRALFFNDRVALGWVRDGDVIEVAAHDATAGVVFYTIENGASGNGASGNGASGNGASGNVASGNVASGFSRTSPPQFKRRFECLGCHVTGDTLGVPGLLMFSTTRPEPSQLSGFPRHIDQSDPIERRFGGWFVTGSTGAARHMGNAAAALDGRPTRELASVAGLFDPDGYRARTSDVVAHLVLTHQAGMTNLLTRAAWEARLAASSGADAATVTVLMRGIASEVVDHLLFVDEAPLPDRVRGSSGFAGRFSAAGPRDRKGRSLYELDLTRRLMKYRCSFLIYSPAFDALPPAIREPIYRRMIEVLSTRDKAERDATIEILRDTKKDLPAFMRGG